MRTLQGEDDLWIEGMPAPILSNHREVPATVGNLANGEILRFKPCGHGAQEGACPIAIVPGLVRVGIDIAAWDDFRDAVDDAAEALGPILAAIAQGILSAFPGIGSVLAMALAAGISLARGRPIEEVIVTAAASAIPGGPAASAAFTNAIVIGTKIAKGENLGQIALDTVNTNLARLPGGAQLQTAFQGVVNVARGRDVGDAALALLRQNLPGGDAAKQAFDVTVRIARGQPVADALLQQVRAALPPGISQTAFDTSVAIAKGQPLSKAAIDAARAAALANGGQAALDSFNVTVPLSMGASLDALALKAVRDKVAPALLAAFDQSITIAQAVGLQNSGFQDAATFMPWQPQYGTLSKAQAIADIQSKRDFWGPNVLSPSDQALADKAYDFGHATDRAIAQGETAMIVLMRDLITDLARLDPAQWDLFPQIVSHLEANRSDFDHDLQDEEAGALAKRYETVFPWGTSVSETIVRAALGSVPYTIKPPFTGRKDKRRGEADISASFQRAIPGAKARRAQITNAIKALRVVDRRLMSGATVEQTYAWTRGPLGGAEADLAGGESAVRDLTRDQIYERAHVLARKGLAKDDFIEWRLLDDPGGKAAATWKTEADFLAAPTLPFASEYRRRADLEKSLAYRELNGTAEGRGKQLLDKANADLAKAKELDAIEFQAYARGPIGLSYVRAKTPAEIAAESAQAQQTYTAVQRAHQTALMGEAFAAEARAKAAAEVAYAQSAYGQRLLSQAQFFDYYFNLARLFQARSDQPHT